MLLDSSPMGGNLTTALLGLGALVYFIPSIVAGSRHTLNSGAVVVVNLFLGWTFIGWVVALAMASSGKSAR
jgi:hypothetical protein